MRSLQSQSQPYFMPPPSSCSSLHVETLHVSFFVGIEREIIYCGGHGKL
jgi:hypothetical protein